jgi:hypothetical protein
MAINRYNAKITFADVAGKQGNTVIKEIPVAAAPDMTSVLAIATALKAASNAGILSYSLLGWESASFAGTATPAGLNTVKAMVLTKYVVGGIEVFRHIFIPNPGQTVIEEVSGLGTRLTAAALTAITNALTASAGFAVTAIEGKVIVRNKRASSSPTGIAIEFVDSNLNSDYLTLPENYVTTAAALVTLATALQTAVVSSSKITFTHMLTKTEALPDPTSGIGLAAVDDDDVVFSSVTKRIKLFFSYEVGDKRKYQTVIIPAPKQSELVKSGKSWKMDDAGGDGLAEDLSTFLGETKTLTYVDSKLESKDLK